MPISEAIGPVDELLYKENVDKPVRCPISVGMVPGKRFESKSKPVSLDRRPISEGIGSFSELEYSHSSDNFDKEPISVGMVQVS